MFLECVLIPNILLPNAHNAGYLVHLGNKAGHYIALNVLRVICENLEDTEFEYSVSNRHCGNNWLHFIMKYREGKIVLCGSNAEHLLDLQRKASSLSLPSHLTQDAGRTQVRFQNVCLSVRTQRCICWKVSKFSVLLSHDNINTHYVTLQFTALMIKSASARVKEKPSVKDGNKF